MKKVKFVVRAILRGVCFLLPGAVFGWWAWGKAIPLISILAAVGVEFLFLFVFAFLSIAVKAVQDVRRKKSADEEIV